MEIDLRLIFTLLKETSDKARLFWKIPMAWKLPGQATPISKRIK
jgi:hypothetical protein